MSTERLEQRADRLTAGAGATQHAHTRADATLDETRHASTELGAIFKMFTKIYSLLLRVLSALEEPTSHMFIA